VKTHPARLLSSQPKGERIEAPEIYECLKASIDFQAFFYFLLSVNK
jgi:hypothetical protein